MHFVINIGVKKMRVELVNLNDLEELMNIYSLARFRMIEEGNITQWDNSSVFRDELVFYIQNNILYKVVKNDEILGYFAFIYEEENAYNIINGKWLNEEKYVTIHKIASKYNNIGIGSYIIKYVINRCKNENIYNVKIDTHANNKSMNKFLINKGFVKCGVISLTLDFKDAYSLRNAYQYNIMNGAD